MPVPNHPARYLPVALGLALVLACGRPTDRPLSGARPGKPEAPPAPVPPTLSVGELHFDDLPSPSPVVRATSPPQPSVAPAAPTIRSVQPAPNALLPPDVPVTIAAAVEGRGADLASVSLTLDDAPARAVLDQRDMRSWTIAARQEVPGGDHRIRLVVSDTAGRTTTYTWQFFVGEPTPTPEPTEPPAPTPEATPTRAPVPPTATSPPAPATAVPRPPATPTPRP